MQRFPLQKLVEDAKSGKISYEKHFEKICGGIYHMPLCNFYERDKTEEKHASIQKVMEYSQMGEAVPSQMNCFAYGDIVSVTTKKCWEAYVGAMEYLGRLMVHISENKWADWIGGLR